MSISVGIFLMVLGVNVAFAVEATTPGINVHTLGIILVLTGLIAVLYPCSGATCPRGIGAEPSPAAAR